MGMGMTGNYNPQGYKTVLLMLVICLGFHMIEIPL